RNPMIAKSGVHKERPLRSITGHFTAQYGINILSSIIINVTKGYRPSLLQMANVGRRRGILKESAFCIAKHTLGYQGAIVRAPGTEVDVRPAVIIKVSEVATHRIDNPIQPDFPSHIAKAASMVSIQARQFRGKGQAQVTGSDLPGSVSTAC